MGDFVDDIINSGLDYVFEDFEYARCQKNQNVWVTQHGDEIPLAELTTEHLVRIIYYLQRGNKCYGQSWDDWQQQLESEFNRRKIKF